MKNQLIATQDVTADWWPVSANVARCSAALARRIGGRHVYSNGHVVHVRGKSRQAVEKFVREIAATA